MVNHIDANLNFFGLYEPFYLSERGDPANTLVELSWVATDDRMGATTQRVGRYRT